jgi:hypothetical protein
MLTQPIVSALANRGRVLLAGCGGGYDILGALPRRDRPKHAGKTPL